MDFVPLINGTAHAFADITFNILGVPMAGVQAIQYAEEQTKENNFGAGRFVVSRGYGQIEPSASITLLAEEVAALEAAAPNGRLQDIPPFDIPVIFQPRNSTVIYKDVLRNCEFTKNERDASTGDTGIPVELPLIISHVDWNQ